jgi:hypothetical protein
LESSNKTMQSMSFMSKSLRYSPTDNWFKDKSSDFFCLSTFYYFIVRNSRIATTLILLQIAISYCGINLSFFTSLYDSYFHP